MIAGPQLFVMAFGAFLATVGMVLFALFLWFKSGSSDVHKLTFLRFGIETSHPSLIIFVVGCALIVTPLFVANGNASELLAGPSSPATPTAQVQLPGGPAEPAGNGGAPQSPTATPTPAPTSPPTAAAVTAATLAGIWRLRTETLNGQLTGRSGDLEIEATGAATADFVAEFRDGFFTAVVFGDFAMRGDRLVGRQQDSFGNADSLDVRFSYSASAGSETLEMINQDLFGNQSLQVWVRP